MSDPEPACSGGFGLGRSGEITSVGYNLVPRQPDSSRRRSPLVRRWVLRDNGQTMRLVLFVLAFILVVAAVVGGVAISSVLWLLLIAALVSFAIGVFTGRIDD